MSKLESNRLSTCNVLVMWRVPLNAEDSKKEYVVNEEYEFKTIGNTSIPINVPIDFVDDKGEVLGQVRVKEYNTNMEETKGNFVVVSLK